MIKTSLTKVSLYVIVSILLLSIVHAAGTKLIFSDVDAKVGGRTSNNLKNGDRIDEEAKPGDNVEFRVKVMSNFTSQELKIKDITVKVTIEGIDDGGDLEEESALFDLSPQSDKRVTLNFQVPLEVEEDTFDAVIHIEGEDKNGTTHESEMRLRLEVNKETHSLKIVKAALSPAQVSCNRKNVHLSASVLNIGSDDERDVTFHLQNSELELDLKDEAKELTAEPREPESRFSKVYTFNVPDDLEAGDYPISLSVLYNNDRKRAEETSALTVNDCEAKKQQTGKKISGAAKSPEQSGEVEVITPTASSKTTQPAAQLATSSSAIPEGTVVTQEGIFSSQFFVIGVIIAEIIAVIVGILLIAYLFKRRQ